MREGAEFRHLLEGVEGVLANVRTLDDSHLECVVLEIRQRNQWLKVNAWIFRSWTGERRVNGLTYNGPVYILGTNERNK